MDGATAAAAPSSMRNGTFQSTVMLSIARAGVGRLICTDR